MAYGFEDSMEHTQQWIYNDFQLQHPTSSMCGYYAIAYSLAKLQGFSLSEFIEIFSSDTQQNDAMVFELIHSLL